MKATRKLTAGVIVAALRSPLRDAGLSAPWLLGCIGGTDLAGKARVVGKGVDIGAFECQELQPALRITVR